MTEIFRKGELLPSKNPPIFIETLLSPTKARYVTDQRLSLFLCNIHELEAGSYYEMYKVHICTPFLPEKEAIIACPTTRKIQLIFISWWRWIHLVSPLLRILVILCSAFDSGDVVNGKTLGTLFIVRQISTSYRPLGRSEGCAFFCVARQYTFNTHR